MLNKDANERGIAEAIAYASSHGIIVAQSNQAAPGTSLSHAPMTYKPSQFDATCYKEAQRITPALNKLLYRIACNRAYLSAALEETAAADAEFTGRLLALMPLAPAPGTGVEMGIYRYDYFVHAEDAARSLRMVEVNCIAASFACLGTKTGDMHRYLASMSLYDAVSPDALPRNDAMSGLATAIATAHAQYVALYAPDVRSVVMMIVQPGECNAYDQYLLQTAVWGKHGVELIRMSLLEIHMYGSVNEKGRLRIVHPRYGQEGVEISVAYYRAGYTPNDYPSDKEWHAREIIERSAAAKCPSVAMQLVGTKKIQQVLDQAGEVEKFVDTEEEAASIRATFARQYSLSAADGGEKAAQMAIERPDDFVLKPQREGGGNNLYTDELKSALQSMSGKERSAYVLMERIRPVVVENILIRNGMHSLTNIVSEFGVYGVHVSTDGKDVLNGTGGTLLRSKAASHDDGGVAAGVAVLDSPLLIE